MEMNPQRVRSAEFKTVRKGGADPDEVRVFLNDVADELERAQNQSTAMEARARAAVARLQEVSEQASAAPAVTVDASVEESETISRTLLLAQRTADSTVAEATAEANRIVSAAKQEAAATLDSTREMSAQLLDEARTEARRVGEGERQSVLGEVEALKARRDFLESDVHHLETFLVDQRARVREAATALMDLAERVPGGIGEVRAPLLSASDDAGAHSSDRGDVASADPIDDLPPQHRDDTADDQGDDDDLLIVTGIADDRDTGAETDNVAADAGAENDADQVWAGGDDPTQAMPVVRPDGTGDEFRFSFDDDRR